MNAESTATEGASSVFDESMGFLENTAWEDSEVFWLLLRTEVENGFSTTTAAFIGWNFTSKEDESDEERFPPYLEDIEYGGYCYKEHNIMSSAYTVSNASITIIDHLSTFEHVNLFWIYFVQISSD